MTINHQHLDYTYIMMYTIVMKRTQIYLSSQQHAKLKSLALKDHTTVSGVLRNIIDEKINNSGTINKDDKTLNAGEWLLAQAKWAEDNDISGPADLSSNLDEYLYGDK